MREIEIHKVISKTFDCDEKTPEEVESMLKELLKEKTKGAIITLRFEGMLKTGKITDIDFRGILDELPDAYFIMKNTASLKTKDFEAVKVHEDNVDDIEKTLINEHIGQIELFEPQKEKELTKKLLHILSQEKKDGETVSKFQERIISDVDRLV